MNLKFTPRNAAHHQMTAGGKPTATTAGCGHGDSWAAVLEAAGLLTWRAFLLDCITVATTFLVCYKMALLVFERLLFPMVTRRGRTSLRSWKLGM